MRAFLDAVAFMTIIPVPAGGDEHDGARLGRSAAWFPVVGFIPGLLILFCGIAARGGTSTGIMAFIAVILIVVITGALHLDGLADWADSYGGKSQEDAYRIMKDSRIGTFGAAALILLLIGKCFALQGIYESAIPLGAIVIAPVLSRWSLLLTMALAPESLHKGLASSFPKEEMKGAFIKGSIFALIIFLAAPIGCWWLWPMAAAGAFIMRWDGVQRIGYVTGDILGAQCEVVELFLLVALAL